MVKPLPFLEGRNADRTTVEYSARTGHFARWGNPEWQSQFNPGVSKSIISALTLQLWGQSVVRPYGIRYPESISWCIVPFQSLRGNISLSSPFFLISVISRLAVRHGYLRYVIFAMEDWLTEIYCCTHL